MAPGPVLTDGTKAHAARCGQALEVLCEEMTSQQIIRRCACRTGTDHMVFSMHACQKLRKLLACLVVAWMPQRLAYVCLQVF